MTSVLGISIQSRDKLRDMIKQLVEIGGVERSKKLLKEALSEAEIKEDTLGKNCKLLQFVTGSIYSRTRRESFVGGKGNLKVFYKFCGRGD